MSKQLPVIVVSAINIFEGGPLTILDECLTSLNTTFFHDYTVIAFVHRKEPFLKFSNITFYELPKSRTNWLYRIYYEYSYFKSISYDLSPFLWLSLHDVSPILFNTRKQCVYCHNPSIFYSPKVSEFYYDKTHFLFSVFYKFLYRFNQKKNNYLIVQQDWIRKKFSQQFGFPVSNIVVAYPGSAISQEIGPLEIGKLQRSSHTFIYAAFPRIFKNYEIIVEAVHLLLKMGITNFQVKFTLDGSENAYSKKIFAASQEVEQIKFLGLLSREQVSSQYENSDILIFPSRLETWGLPLTEFKRYNKPILAAELEYARETVGSYDKIAFFNPDDPNELAKKMALIIKNEDKFLWGTTTHTEPAQPFTSSWDEMLEFILTH